MAVKNRQVLKALFAKSEMARDLAHLIDSAQIRPDDTFYGKWSPHTLYQNGDVVLYDHDLYMLILNQGEKKCEDEPQQETGLRSPQPPNEASMKDKWYNMTQSQFFYLEDGGEHEGIYFIKKNDPAFHPFKKPEYQGTVLLHIGLDGQVHFSNYKGDEAHLNVEGAVSANRFYQKTADTELDNTGELENAMEKLKPLRPLMYQQKGKKFQQKENAFRPGFDPASFGNCMEEVAHPTDDKQIDFQGIVPVLVKAVQELHEALEKEKKINSELIGQMKKATKTLEQIQQRLDRLDGPTQGKINTNDGY